MFNLKYLPFRAMSDFVLDAHKYGMPAVHDLAKFNNRVVSNLLYYQTNYLVVAASVFFLFLMSNFQKLVIGAVAITPAVALIARQLGREVRILDQLQRQNPNAILALSAVEALLVYLAYNQIWFFLVAASASVGFTVLHAAFRKRGIKNVINNSVEKVSGAVYENTPMEIALKSIGVNTVNVNDRD